MQQSEQLYRQFLEEMSALEGFRLAFATMHPGASLEREDPDVRRLIEAMAFFTARTRIASRRNILATRRRLFQQFFSYLLSPLPAAALVQFQPTGRFAEVTDVPALTEVAVTSNEAREAIFQTTRPVRVLPLRIRGVDLLKGARGAQRVVIDLEAAYARNDDIGTLSFFLSHLNNFQASLQLLDKVQSHLVRVLVCHDERITEDSEGTPCMVRFGPPADDPNDGRGKPNPIEEVRSRLHFPEQDLFMHIAVPRPPRNWRRFSILLDLAPTFPKGMSITEEMLKLFVVPIINLRKDFAKPFEHDGTVERQSIGHPEPRHGFELCEVHGVYTIEKMGMQPLRPGLLAGGEGSYEVEWEEPQKGQPGVWLKVCLPGSLEEPKRVAIEATWVQPWFSQEAVGTLKVRLRTRVLRGVDLELVGDVRTQLDTDLKHDMEGLLHVLSMRGKPRLTLEDVQFMLRRLVNLGDGKLASLLDLFLSLTVTTLPRARELGGGLRHVYQLKLRPVEEAYLPLVRFILSQLTKILNAWVSDGVVEVEAAAMGSPDVLRFS